MKSLLLLVFCLSSCTLLFAQPGTLDPTFGENGKVLQKNIKDFNDAAMVVAKDGRILIGTTGGYSFKLDALKTDGSHDSSFGENGSAFGLFPNAATQKSFATITSLALLPDGKILAGGSILVSGDITESDYLIAFCRFNANGIVDSSFGSNGVATATFGYGYEGVKDMAVQDDGKIVIVSSVTTNVAQFKNQFFLARFLANGSKDLEFGNQGMVLSATVGSANSVAIQKYGKIIAAGFKRNPNTYQNFHLERYNSDGRYDLTFDADGKVDSQIGIDYCVINDVVLQEDGKILVTGSSNGGISPKFTVVRYNVQGSIDPSFGEAGVAATSFPEYSGVGNKIMLAGSQKDKIIVAGSNFSSDFGNFALVGYNANGTLDPEFGNNGIQLTNFGDYDYVIAADLQQDGKIVVSGYEIELSTSNFSRALARYNGYPTQRPLFVRVKKWLQNHGISWKGLPATDNVDYYSVERSSSASKGFTQIAKVSGATHLNNYNLTNSNLLQGDNYYRIKAVSKTGGIVYSEVVNASNVAGLQANIYPNPATNYVVVKGLPANTKTKINLADASGNVLATANSNGATQYRFNTDRILPGTYSLQLTTEGKTEMVKFVKQ